MSNAGQGIEALISKAKPPTRSVAICLDADLMAEHDQLQAELEQADRTERVSLGDGGSEGLAEQVRDVENRMKASMVRFRFKGLSMFALGDLQRRYPAPEGQRGAWDTQAGAAELLALSAVEPTMNAEQAGRLLESLSHGQGDKLFSAAWAASVGSVDVPFSVRASARTRPPEQ